MNWFISDAMAADATGDAGIMSFLPLVIIFIIFYFLLIRPQQKRAKEHKNMLVNLVKGNEVVTAGGILAKITVVGENFITIDTGHIELQIQRAQITQLMPKGTIKSVK